MATKSPQTSKAPTRRKGSAGKRKKTDLGDTPIVISGGSVSLEYPDGVDDGFDDDGSTMGVKKKLRHRRGPTLRTIEIKNAAESVTFLTIDLDELGVKRNCKIKIFYR